MTDFYPKIKLTLAENENFPIFYSGHSSSSYRIIVVIVVIPAVVVFSVKVDIVVVRKHFLRTAI